MLCPDCYLTIHWVTPPYCPVCVRRVPLSPTASLEECQAACSFCATRSSNLDGMGAAAEFDGVIRQAIHEFKYQGRTDLAVPLADFMVSSWRDGFFPVDCMIPVPLHPRRLRERGYNQAALMTERLTEKIGLPVLGGVLIRSRMTASQTRLSASDRRKNVEGAFSAYSNGVKGRSMLLVDDLCTTGSTLEACADALRAAGAVRVYAMTLARAGFDPTTGMAGDSEDWQGRDTLLF